MRKTPCTKLLFCVISHLELFYYGPQENLSGYPEIIVTRHNKVTVMTLQPFTNEHLNYFKFVSVVSTEFPKILRQAFKTRLDNTFGHHAESFALAIDQLRLLRNAVSHSPSSEIPKATFDMYIQLTKDAFQALGVSSSCVNTIGSLTEADFPIEKVRKLEDEIRKRVRLKMRFLKTK